MYAINSIPLTNDAFGWALMAPSEPLSELRVERVDVPLAGRHGSARGVPGRLLPTMLSFIVRTPRANVEPLFALWSEPRLTLTDTQAPGRSAEVELVQLTPRDTGAAEEHVDVAAQVRMPDPVWRDAVPTVYGPAAFANGQASLELTGLWPGLSSAVQDAQLLFKGPIQEPVVTDPSGATFRYESIVLANEWLRLDTATRRAFLTPQAAWSGGDERSGWINYGGPREAFEITPRFTDPADRAGRLTVSRGGSLTTVSPPTVQVRGRGAYLIT